MAFKILCHEDALAGLEEIFSSLSEQYSESTEQFANDLFNHIELLQTFPYIGASVQGDDPNPLIPFSPVIF